MGTTLTEREAREYRLGEALLALADGRPRTGLAFDISRDLSRTLPAGTPRYEFELFMPLAAPVARAGLDAGTSTKGQELVFQRPLPYIDALRALTQVIRLGATVLDGLQGNVEIPRLTGTPAATMVAQNPGSDVAQADQALDQLPLSPHTAQATTAYSRQLLKLSQVSTGVDRLVAEDIAKRHAVLIDKMAIQGSGASNQPTGILNASGIGSVAIGTNGGNPSYKNIVALETAVSAANVDVAPGDDDGDQVPVGAFLTTPQMVDTLRRTDRQTTSGQFVLQHGECIDYPFAPSTNVPSTLTKGTAIGVCHAIIFGRWDYLAVGLWDAVQLVVDPFALKKQGVVEVTSFQLFDIALRHVAGFAAIQDATVLP